jgi:general secretion pathway protein B
LPPAAAPPVVPPPAPAPADVPAPADEYVPTLAALTPGERAALPPLKLSMHVWNSDAARRFAIVDGQRVVEGTRVGAAVVTAIRRDGVVLDVNGRSLLLPRP